MPRKADTHLRELMSRERDGDVGNAGQFVPSAADSDAQPLAEQHQESRRERQA
jgi:hypothetical protein